MKIKKLLLVAAMAVVALNSCENGNLEDNLLAVELEELNDSDLSSSNSSVKDFGLSTHKSMEIHFSRKEIKNKTTKNITFMANYDWDKGQSHNKLKVLEYDPGSDIKINVKFFSKIKIGEAEIGREFSTDIKINRGDDDIMDHTIPRTAMFTNQTRITDNHYRKYFSGDGVTVGVNIKGINGLEF